jgi:hypothetical protein
VKAAQAVAVLAAQAEMLIAAWVVVMAVQALRHLSPELQLFMQVAAAGILLAVVRRALVVAASEVLGGLVQLPMAALGLQTQEAAAVELVNVAEFRETVETAVPASSLLPTRHRWHRCHQSAVV